MKLAPMPAPRRNIAKHQPHDRGVRADQTERNRHQHRHHDADQRDPTTAVAVGHAGRQRHRDRHAEALGGGQQTGVDHAVAADLLPIEGHQDHGAEHRGTERKHDDRRGREVPPAVEVQVEQRVLDTQCVDHECRHERNAGQNRDIHMTAVEGAVGSGLGQSVGDGDESGRHQHQADEVKRLGPCPIERG